jgi:O-antigen/teichoic acid export membrane protein
MISKLVSLVSGILVVPFIINNLGIDGFGLWEIILAISTLLFTFQSSISYIIMWQTSSALGLSTENGVVEWYRKGLFFAYAQFVIFFMAIILFSQNLLHMFNVPADLYTVSRHLLLWICFFTLLNNVTEVISAVLSSYHLSGYAGMVQSLTQAFGFLVMILLLIGGYGYNGLIIGFVINKILNFLILYFKFIKVTGIKTMLLSIPTRKNFITIKNYLWYTVIGSVANISRDQLIKLIISNLASTKVVGYFGIATRLSQLIIFMCSFFTIPTISESASLNSSGNIAGVKNIFQRVTNSVIFISGFFTIIVAGLGQLIVYIWVNDVNPGISDYISIILLGNLVAIILTGAGTAVCKGIGKVELETRYIMVNLCLYAILLFFMLPLFGFLGAIITSSLAWAVSSLYFSHLLTTRTYLTSATLKKAGIAIIIIIFFTVLFQQLFPLAILHSPSRLIACLVVGVISLLFLPIYYLVMYYIGVMPAPQKILLFTKGMFN